MIRPKLEKWVHRIVVAFFLLLIFSLGIMKPTVEIPRANLTPTDLIFPIAFACWLAALVLRVRKFEWHPAYWALSLYFIALLISAIFSTNPALSFSKLVGEFYLILIAVLTANMVETLGRFRLVFMAWLAGAFAPILVACIGIALFYLQPDSTLLPDITYHYGAVPVGNFPRLSSTFISASMFCNYLTVTLMLVFISLELGWLNRTAARAWIISISVIAAFTVSIALGGIFLAVGLWIYFRERDRRASKVALATASVITIGFLVIAPVSLNDLSTLTPSSRLLVWGDALNTFLANPITGKGVGMGVANVAYQNSEGTWSLLTDAHNIFLSIAAQSGLIGLIGLIAVVTAVLRIAFVTPTATDSATVIRAGLGIAFVSAFVYEGLTGAFENARHLWVLIGLIIACAGIRAKPFTDARPSPEAEHRASHRRSST